MKNGRRALIMGLAVLLVLTLVLVLRSNSGASFLTLNQQMFPGPTPMPARSLLSDPITRAVPAGELVGGIAITPPVTEEKVREFIAKVPIGGPVFREEAATTHVQFMSIAHLQTVLNDGSPIWASLPADREVVYVTQTGNFYFDSFEGDQEIVHHFLYRVFDARTGNELVSGTR